MKTTIPALPEHLRDVPDIRERGDSSTLARWLAWKQAILAYRELVRRECETDAQYQRAIDRECAADPAYALIIYGMIYEPRTRKGRGGNQPFIPFGWQVELIRWFEAHMDEEMSDGYISKARGLGATWIFCWIAIHGWLWRSPFDSLLVSRNAEQVDRKFDKKAMFTKIQFFMDHLPERLLPSGFDPDIHRNVRLIYNPENGNTISGDATTVKAGRGDRATFILYDEAAAIPDFDATWGTGGGTTDHRFAISTESMDEGGVFHTMWVKAKATNPNAVLELDWWRNPYFDEEWYEQTRNRFIADGQLHVFEREYLRDYLAGRGGSIYPYAQTMVGKNLIYTPGQGRMLYCCIDPGIRDESAYHWVQYDPGDSTYLVLESYMRSGFDSGYHASIMLGIPISGKYDYDSDAIEVMKWTSQIKDPIIYVGDPYGESRSGDGKQTYYEGLAEKSAELTDGTHRILVRTSWEPEDRGLDGRIEALRDLLPRTTFNDTPRVRRALAAVQEYRYKDIDDSKEVLTVSNKPIHTAGSHYVTALEYLAVHRRGVWRAKSLQRQHAVHQRLNGRQITAKRTTGSFSERVAPPMTSRR